MNTWNANWQVIWERNWRRATASLPGASYDEIRSLAIQLSRREVQALQCKVIAANDVFS